jgi:flagellar hook protein FlgE
MVGSGFFTASISGLRGQSEAFASISQNVANLTTGGYKASDTLFSDLVNSGRGSIFEQFSGFKANTRNLINTQGSILSTGRALDVAIDGAGFLVTNTRQDGSGDTLLTRAGSLGQVVVGTGSEQQAFLVDRNGNFFQGFPADGNGGFTISTSVGGLQPIRIDRAAALSSAVATTSATLTANLPANATSGTSFNLSAGVFDSLGTPHALQFEFTKTTSANTWNLVASTADGTLTAGSPATMTFDTTGKIVSPLNQSVSITWTDPVTAAPSTIGVDFSAMTQFGASFSPSIVNSNGNAIGNLESVSINARGEVVGLFSNGLSRGLAKLPIAVVRNINGLTPLTATNFSANAASGPIRLLEVDLTTFANFTPLALENSTVILANEFTKLIVTQRAYSSAAKSIQVIDEMFQIATRLKS